LSLLALVWAGACREPAADAAGKALVVVAPSALSVSIGPKFRDVAVPVVCSEPYLLDDLAMTGPVGNVDLGFVNGATSIAILEPGSALAAGTRGTVTVFAMPAELGWGVPGPAALRVASLVGEPQKLTIFAYPAGAMMIGRAAPAARVGLFSGNLDNQTAMLTGDGLKLFSAAVSWATQR